MIASMSPESLLGPISSLGEEGYDEQEYDNPTLEGSLNTPLHATAVNGNKSLLQKLINEAGGDASVINMGDRFGRTPLVYSVLGDRLDCAETLLKNGAFVSLADVDGRTPLHWAAYQGNHKCVKLLLAKGANWKAKDTKGRTPFHFAASYKNSSKCLSLLLKMVAKGEVDDPDNNSMTALHWGSSFGNAEHVKLLLKFKASVILQDAEKKTPLHWAATHQNANVLKLILEESTEMINWRDTEGRTALHHAVAQQNEAVVRTLLSIETCDASIQDNTYRAPLHWAAVLGNSQIVKLLLRKNADYLSVDANGATPLHYCTQSNLAQTVEVFMSYSKMKDVPDKEGQTAIMWAAGKGASEALETMLRHNLDVHATDKSGGTALHAAAYAGQLKCVQLLLQHGASVNALDMHNHTPIFRACETGHTDVVITLLENGAAVILEDQDGRSPLHWAALGGHTHICQTLIKNGVPADKKDRLGCTPLHCAAYGGFVNCMSVLIDYGALVNACDKEGISALHWSCSSGHLEAVKLLMRHGAFPNFMENDGERLTPLDYAIFGDHQDVAQYMLEQGGLTITAIQDVAATAVQACWRGYRVRKPFQDRKNLYVKHEQLKKDMKKQEEIRRRRLALNNASSSSGTIKNDYTNDEDGRTIRKDNVMSPNKLGNGSVEIEASIEDEYLDELKYSSSSARHSCASSIADYPLSLSTILEQSFSESQRDFRDKLTNAQFEEGEVKSDVDKKVEFPEKRISEQIGEILQIINECEETPTSEVENIGHSNCVMMCGVATSCESVSHSDLDRENHVTGWDYQGKSLDPKISSLADRARKERQRLRMFRTKVNAATIIQKWFRSSRSNKTNRPVIVSAIDELLMDHEELRQQIAALVIQLAWRRYSRGKVKFGLGIAEERDTFPASESLNGTESYSEVSNKNNIDANQVRTPRNKINSAAENTRQPRRTKSGVFSRRLAIFQSRNSTSADSRRSLRSAPSPAAASYNVALDMYNPLSTRRTNDRSSVPRRGNNRVRPSVSRRPVTGWGADTSPRTSRR